jgi:hypothetical protein
MTKPKLIEIYHETINLAPLSNLYGAGPSSYRPYLCRDKPKAAIYNIIIEIQLFINTRKIINIAGIITINKNDQEKSPHTLYFFHGPDE